MNATNVQKMKCLNEELKKKSIFFITLFKHLTIFHKFEKKMKRKENCIASHCIFVLCLLRHNIAHLQKKLHISQKFILCLNPRKGLS